jgi:hypothetical protein
LEGAVTEKNEALAKMFLELKHYQNELLNREAAYNKLFSAKPSVGVLNMIERKVKRDNLSVETATVRTLPPLTDTPDMSPERPFSSAHAKKKSAPIKPDKARTPRK